MWPRQLLSLIYCCCLCGLHYTEALITPFFKAHNAETAIEGSYVVFYKPGIDLQTVASNAIMTRVICFVTHIGCRIPFEWGPLGFALEDANEESMEAIADLPGIIFIEQNRLLTKTALTCDQSKLKNSTTKAFSWGLDRIDQRNLPLSSTFSTDDVSGRGVNIYFLDSGINTDLTEFEGRAEYGATFCMNPCTNRRGDVDGHGTMMAGVAMSRTLGVAKNANGISVRILNDNGVGSTATVISGLIWSISHFEITGKRPSIMSLPVTMDGISFALNIALNSAAGRGISVVVSAGNDDRDSCFVSPASASGVITVGCSNENDRFCSFSNFGSCININAPGENILTISAGDTTTVSDDGRITTSTTVASGTSMSAAHVVGGLARIKSLNPELSVEKAEHVLKAQATTGELSGVPLFTTSKLLFVDTRCPDLDD